MDCEYLIAKDCKLNFSDKFQMDRVKGLTFINSDADIDILILISSQIEALKIKGSKFTNVL